MASATVMETAQPIRRGFDRSARGSRGDAGLTGLDATGSKNMLQLVHLRWVAVVGQIMTITFVQVWLGIPLPLPAMTAVVGVLVVLNGASLLRLFLPFSVGQAELFTALAFDVAALTALLYLSGGITNPFISLYLLQVTLAAVLLEAVWIWAMVAMAMACFVGLAVAYRPLVFPATLSADPATLHLLGLVICFILDAVLLVIFVTRISRNLRARDAHLARMRQQAVEEEHVVRMGLLASGAAHELGTPLSTVSVILGDWQTMPALRAIPELAEEIGEMQQAVHRCKSIITGILLSAGEARGEAPTVTTVAAFLDDLVRAWEDTRPHGGLVFENAFGQDLSIVADPALKQILSNLLDNAHEAPSPCIRLAALRNGADLVLIVSDDGPGFAPDMLAQFGHPYRSTKGRLGGGLGLFLVVNVVRKLGGWVEAENRPGGGATVTLTLPLSALAIMAVGPKEESVLAQ